jgi:hypothetical protein
VRARHVPALLSLAIGFQAAPAAAATEAPRIVVLADPDAARDQNLLAADLRSRGFEVVLTDVGEGDERERTASATTRLHAVAVLRVKDHGDLIEVWISGDPDKPARMRDTVAPFSDTQEAHSDAVVRAIELMRATLIEVRSTANAAKEPAPSRPAPAPRLPEIIISRSAETARQRSVSLAVGLGPLHGSGGATTAFVAPLDLRLALPHPWAISLRAVVPVRNAWIRQAEGTAHIVPLLIGASAWITPWRGGVLVPFLGAGASAVVLRLSADANPGYEDYAARYVAFMPQVTAGTSVRLTELLGIRGELWAGSMIPHARIRFVDHEAGSWGQMVTGAALSVEVWPF